MLTHIYVKNFVLIDQVALDFSDGMSVFTGETGAGKSLLIDAISLLCGERASASYVKKGCAKAVIEGVFDIHDDARANALLREQGFDLDGEDLIVSREISAEGKSTIRIAQRTCTAAFLRELMSGLVDIHSQHDNQYLLQPRYHLSLLDRYDRNDALLHEVNEAYQDYDRLRREIDDALQERYNSDDLDELTAILNEIDDAQIQEDELSSLEEEVRAMSRHETIQKQAAVALELLDGEHGSNPSLYEAAHALESISDIEPYTSIHQELLDAYYQIEETLSALHSALENSEFDEETLNRKQERIFLYHRMYRKYGGSYAAVCQYRNEVEEKIDRILHRQDYLERKEKELAEKKERYECASSELHEHRMQSALLLERAVNAQLSDLLLEHARFHIAILPSQDSVHGNDRVEFQVSMNRSGVFTPLQKSASGGELSRLMLGLKCIFTRLQGIRTVIFDEIDTGVSGAVALAIGKKMQLLSEDIQVFCVTHLAQVAASGDHHLLVSKQDDGSLTTTSIHSLSEEERIRELAAIASSSQSEASLQAARELYAAARR